VCARPVEAAGTPAASSGTGDKWGRSRGQSRAAHADPAVRARCAARSVGMLALEGPMPHPVCSASSSSWNRIFLRCVFQVLACRSSSSRRKSWWLRVSNMGTDARDSACCARRLCRSARRIPHELPPARSRAPAVGETRCEIVGRRSCGGCQNIPGGESTGPNCFETPRKIACCRRLGDRAAWRPPSNVIKNRHRSSNAPRARIDVAVPFTGATAIGAVPSARGRLIRSMRRSTTRHSARRLTRPHTLSETARKSEDGGYLHASRMQLEAG